MNSQVEEKVLSECGFILSARRSHATEYKNKDIIIYTVDISSLNLIINPEDYDNFLRFVCLKLGKGQSGKFQGINTPMKPGNVIRSNDGQVKYICGRCGGTFLKAPRCPGCGQLVKA